MADQQYLITSNEHEPFLTDWFIAENNFRPDMGMVVQDKQHTETEIRVSHSLVLFLLCF